MSATPRPILSRLLYSLIDWLLLGVSILVGLIQVAFERRLRDHAERPWPSSGEPDEYAL